MRNWIVILMLGICVGCSSASTKENPPEQLSEGCHTPLGFIPEGHTATGYLHQVETREQRCQQGTLSCQDGVWSGAYIYPSCVVTP